MSYNLHKMIDLKFYFRKSAYNMKEETRVIELVEIE